MISQDITCNLVIKTNTYEPVLDPQHKIPMHQALAKHYNFELCTVQTIIQWITLGAAY